jgi:hypothetical protein
MVALPAKRAIETGSMEGMKQMSLPNLPIMKESKKAKRNVADALRGGRLSASTSSRARRVQVRTTTGLICCVGISLLLAGHPRQAAAQYPQNGLAPYAPPAPAVTGQAVPPGPGTPAPPGTIPPGPLAQPSLPGGMPAPGPSLNGPPGSANCPPPACPEPPPENCPPPSPCYQIIDPVMIGDYITRGANRTIPIPGIVEVGIPAGVAGPRAAVVDVPASVTTNLLLPILTNAAFKISQNESPQPQDRVFVNYNYINNIGGADFQHRVPLYAVSAPGAVVPGVQPATNLQSFVVNNPGVTQQVVALNMAATNLNQEILGFEKTLGGNASIEARFPLLQVQGDPSLSGQGFGDISFGAKYAFINNGLTGNVWSLGFMATAPTGSSIIVTPVGDIHNWLYQPWTGFVVNLGDLYVHGFSSLLIPQSSQDATMWFNDLGIGWRLFGNNPNWYVNSLVPTVEVHSTTPLNNYQASNILYVPNMLSLTAGFHVGFGRSELSLAAIWPVMGPVPYDVGGIAQLNIRW